VAQLILERICHPDIEEVKSLDSTDRGEGGYGSTGYSKNDPNTHAVHSRARWDLTDSGFK
jgi:hypothetical protein